MDALLNKYKSYHFQHMVKKINFNSIYNDIKLFLETNIINITLVNSNQLYSLFIGIYFHFTKNASIPEILEKYYLPLITTGNSDAMWCLGNYYQYINFNFKLMEKYYLMAIKQDNIEAMCSFGLYYMYKENNCNLMLKYLIMAANNKHINSHILLGNHYYNNKQYKLTKKYYLLFFKYYNDIRVIDYKLTIYKYIYKLDNFCLL